MSTNGPGSESLTTIEQATTRVNTQALASKGVENVRVLSESRFLEIVGDMVEESIRQRLEGPSTPSTQATQGEDLGAMRDELKATYTAKWKALRSRHLDNLNKVQNRLDQLAQHFEKFERVFQELQGLPESESRLDPPERIRQRRTQLLEQALRE